MPSTFSLFKLSLASRLAISGALYALGVLLQLALNSFPGFWVGVGCFLAGWIPLSIGTISNKPDDQGFEEWRAVTMSEVDRLSDNIGLSQKALRMSMGAGQGLLMTVFIFGSMAGIVLGFVNERRDVYYLFGDLLFMGMPSALFGNISVFIPRELEMKLNCFRALTGKAMPEGVQLVPYLRFDKDKSGGEIPEDVRMMMEPKRKSEDLVGIQFQVVINNGPNGNVPYMYAVAITKGKDGPSYRRAAGVQAGDFIVEEGGDGDYGSVVIRQPTDSGGYETDQADCERLRDAALSALGA